MSNWNGRLWAVGLGSVVAAALTMVACSSGLGSPPPAAEQERAPASPQAVAPSPVVSPTAVAKSDPAPSPVQAVAQAPSPSPGCQPGSARSRPAAVAKEGRAQHGVRIVLDGPTVVGRAAMTRPGHQLKLLLKSLPTEFHFVPVGTGHSIRYAEWKQHHIAEMRFCIVGRERITLPGAWTPASCELPAAWEPYVPSREVSLEVDWIGPREITAMAQFRRADGSAIQSISPTYEPVEATRSAYYSDSVLDPSVPLTSLPPAVQTAVSARNATFPVTGSVKVQNSPCCVGGTMGDTKTVQVTFSATSPHGQVTEMRLGSGGCNTGQFQSASGAWEPFIAQRDMPVTLSSGWSTFAVSVQYRDAAGNLSAVQCDSVGVEGMPRRP